MIYFDLAELLSLSDEMPSTAHVLSDTTRLILLSLLSRVDRWQWRNDGAPVTDEEWDIALTFIDLAGKELLYPMDTLPIGTILIWSLNTLPDNYLWCDGTEIDRASALGELLVSSGCPYGDGDGETTVNLPDMTTKFALGADGTYWLGNEGGEAETFLSVNQLPAHTHSVSDLAVGLLVGGMEGIPGAEALSGSTGATGGGESHNNMPPFLALYYIIKAE